MTENDSNSAYVRSPTKFLIQSFANDGQESIHPPSSVRFVRQLVGQLSSEWQNLNRDELIAKVRSLCEGGVALGYLVRSRRKGVKGYCYKVVMDTSQ